MCAKLSAACFIARRQLEKGQKLKCPHTQVPTLLVSSRHAQLDIPNSPQRAIGLVAATCDDERVATMARAYFGARHVDT